MSTNQKITCSNIWKLFGSDEKRIMKDLDPNLSIKEVQEKTGHVVAVKNVSFSIEKGETFVVMGLSSQVIMDPQPGQLRRQIPSRFFSSVDKALHPR